ncbi:MAG: AAA family ATPase [Armatimonadetes bacterium]|nr:AAA family ATPase [Armatimonadota bacterium]
MRIKSIHIKGFGCLVERSYEFPEGKAALVLENNERGKSTLAAAIFAGLCGFPKRKVAGELVKLKDVYKPWNGENYAVDMEIEAAGKHLRLERDFARDRCVIRDALTNKDISAEYDQDLTLHFLRLPRDDFQRIAFISGKEVHRFSSSPNIQARLSAMIDAGAESGAENAIAALDDARYTLAGKSLKIESAISRLAKDVDSKQRRMRELDTALDAVADEVRELERAQGQCGELSARLDELDREYAAARLKELREQISAAETLDSEAAGLREELAGLEQFAAFPAERKTQLAKAVARIDERRDQIAQMEAESEELRREFERISSERLRVMDGEQISSRMVGYVMLTAGGLCGLTCLGLMILKIVGIVPSLIGTLIGVIVAATGAVRSAHSKTGRSESVISLEARLQEIGRRLAELARNIETRGRDIDEEREIVQSIAQDAGIDDSPACDDVLRRFEEIEAHYRRYRHIKDSLLPAVLKYVAKDEDMKALRAEEAELAARTACTHNEAFPSQNRSSSSIDSDRQAVRTKLDQTQAAIRDLEKSVGVCIENYRREYPALAEELEALQSEMERAARFGKAIEAASGVMREVAEKSHRRWASALNERASAMLPNLNPDYDTLRFDDSLSFTIRHVADNRIIERADIDSCLSTGAKDQIYLAVRMACCEELSRAAEPMPIILDDPLIAADDTRFTEGFRYLARGAADGRQIIILSCHKSRHEAFLREPWFSDSVSVLNL